ncbi:gamma-glutamyl-gamma-aminobutyrate hydrolase family protein [Gilvimarinus agarilyticus]|uniref:glutamine amidotransferase-related protein n=1 Tax=Gilvimarinus sp. 2_MG-2023 TaxID=3062666 RepID=UPI001C0974C3|nr:gamma-glutamyl-gamma-aminobutyrate hydrolase family protein [Gilvimarinus sp. 2_MG-2023]MBU2887786.1 gamma-glutamyl-gamma-aminobutyrate hydrolase family protein [Gilvimarinus agarilyticus]MDO6572425.1 gamma-glutamyl-gamma-aminobutyrate hydrolase family protein [Gilvimarinus sp. 2_MG-2023]
MLPIAIYNTDTIAPHLAVEHGQYPDMFVRSLARQAPLQRFERFDVNREQCPQSLDGFSGVIITGSQSAAYDHDPWINRLKQHIVDLVAQRVPVVGICFGHQVIHQALGGRVEKATAGWCVGTHYNRLTDRAKSLGFAGDGFHLLSSHQDQVQAMAPGAECLASTPDCPIAMTYIAPSVLTFQGHPEFTLAYARALMEGRVRAIGDKKVQGALATLTEPLDDERVLSWILRFLHFGAQVGDGAVTAEL